MLIYYNNYVPLVQLKTINMPRQARKTSGTLEPQGRVPVPRPARQQKVDQGSLIYSEITVWHR